MEEGLPLVRGFQRPSSRLILGLFICWNVLLFILVVVALSKHSKNNTTLVVNNNTTNNTFALTNIISQFAPPPGIQNGHIVSLDNNGQLAIGAGLSIYLNTNILDSADQLKHLEITSPSPSLVVAAYLASNSVYIATGNVTGQQIAWNTPVPLPLISVDNIVSLSPTLVVVIGSPNVVAIQVNSDGTVKVGISTVFVHGSSINPEIAPLSSTSFALSFYQGLQNITLATSVGVVSSALAISFSTAHIYALDKPSHGILPLTNNSYLLLYPDMDAFANVEGGPLVAQLATISSPSTITLSNSATLTDSKANYFFASTKLDETRGVVVFVDTSQNNALIAASIEITNLPSMGTVEVSFGSTLVLNSGDASGPLPSDLWMFIDVAALDNHRFVATYSDLGAGGRVVTTIAELSPSDDLVSLSPEFVITSPNPDEGADYYWVSVAAVSGNQFVIMEALSGVSGVNGGKVAFGEFKNRPLGVVVGPSSGSLGMWDVVVSGVSSAGTLLPGRRYFATTQGDFVPSSLTDFAFSPRPGQYIQYGNIIVSLDSFVGTAVSSFEMLLHT